MRLRTRLALSVVAAALPLAAATVWARYDLEERRVAQVLREFAVTRMESGGRERCERNPATFPPRPQPPRAPRGDRPPVPPPLPELGPVPTRDDEGTERPPAGAVRTRFWAYADDFVSANRRAPVIPPELIESVRGGNDVAVTGTDNETGTGHLALVRMSWTDSPCAFVLVERIGPDIIVGALDLWWTGAFVAAGVLVAVLLASGSVVRRIGRLEDEVRQSAAHHYDTPVAVGGGDEVADLATAFNDAAGQVRGHLAEVERREETLRTFVANTTHDLMTPLTVLQGHLDAFAQAIADGEEPDESVRDAMREVDYTTSLVANLAAGAKLEAGTAALLRRPVDLNALVERVVGRHRPVARAQGIDLNHAVPETALATQGDVTLLEQAVGNVVQNAIRYNRAGGHVAVVLSAEEGDRFLLRIDDDGRGLSEGDLEHLTQRGFRGSAARSRPESGHGLGLDIARGVAERHEIELRFEPRADGGLSVTFRGRTQV